VLDFARAGAAIGSTPATLEKTRALAAYLRTLDDADLRRAAVFMTGRAFSPSQRRTLGLGWSTVSKVLSGISHRDDEELQRIYEEKGFPSHLAREVTEVIMKDPQVALETHAREELGLDPGQLGSPWGAAISSFVTFAVGAAIPLVPFAIGSGTAAIVAAISASAIALLSVGAAMSILTGRPAWLSGARMLAVGAVAASITFGVGRLLHVSTGV